VKALLRELLGDMTLQPRVARRARHERRSGRAEVRWHLELGRAAKLHGCDKAYQIALQLRELDAQGAGFVDEAVALVHLAAHLANRKDPKGAAKRRLDRLAASPFGERRANNVTGQPRIALASPKRVAAQFGCELGRGVPVPSDLLWRLTSSRLAALMVERARGQIDGHPLPTSR
jgi:hypothetical protein